MVQIGERALAVNHNNIINNCGCMRELALHQMRLSSQRDKTATTASKAGARRWMVALKGMRRECRRAQECAGVC